MLENSVLTAFEVQDLIDRKGNNLTEVLPVV